MRREEAFSRAYSVLQCSRSNIFTLSNSSCKYAEPGKRFMNVKLLNEYLSINEYISIKRIYGETNISILPYFNEISYIPIYYLYKVYRHIGIKSIQEGPDKIGRASCRERV